jgi:hypothetical protein
MCAADDSSEEFVYGAADQLRHDLKTPRRAPSLTDEERKTMLAGITAIETAVRPMSTMIDAMGDENHGS